MQQLYRRIRLFEVFFIKLMLNCSWAFSAPRAIADRLRCAADRRAPSRGVLTTSELQ